jgi:hypothetical protein
MTLSKANTSDDIKIDQSLPHGSSLYETLAAHAITLCVVIAAIPTTLGKKNWMLYVEDDFFYYLKTAKNLAHGLGSTFSVVPTNGYHPLWLMLIAAVSRLPSNGSELSVRIFLSVAFFISTLLTYFLSRLLLPALNTKPLLTNALAALIALSAFRLYLGEMEVILTVPLVLAVALAYQSDRLWDGGFWPSAWFGLLLSAMFLSRLDTSLIILMLTIATVANPKLRFRIRYRQIGGTFVGFSPAVLYLVSNQVYFHTWLPISGTSKQLKSNHLPSWPAWHSLLKNGTNFLMVLVVLVAILIIPRIYRKLTAPQQVIYLVLTTFPFVYVLVLSCLSDWPLWSWYLYSLRPALCLSFAVFLLWRPTGRIFKNSVITALIAMGIPVLLYQWKHAPARVNEDIYATATEIRDFAVTHHGIYAMGDRSGTVGYLLSDPMIQTEGLVMDRDFLKLIQNKTPLRQALEQYHVRYYVYSREDPPSSGAYISEDPPSSGCYRAVEPRQAGPNSPHMVADFCQPPLATYVHGKWTNHIFDLDPTAQSPSPLP